jgi:hypothetical protein
VPDAATRSGDFTGQSDIYDPRTSADCSTQPRTLFPGKRVPPSRIDAIATAFLRRFEPLPNSSSASGNYLDSTPTGRTPIALRDASIINSGIDRCSPDITSSTAKAT